MGGCATNECFQEYLYFLWNEIQRYQLQQFCAPLAYAS